MPLSEPSRQRFRGAISSRAFGGLVPLCGHRRMRLGITTPGRAAIDPLVAVLATQERTLDVGCGPSRYGRYFPNRVGVDVAAVPGVHVVASGMMLPFRDRSFSVVLCTEVLEHLTDPAAAVSEMERVLAPGGRCVLSTRFCYPIHDRSQDYFRFTRQGLLHLFRAWDVTQLQADVGLLGTLVPMITARISEFRRPLRSVLVALWIPAAWALGVLGARPDPSNLTSVTSGYLLVARKPESDECNRQVGRGSVTRPD